MLAFRPLNTRPWAPPEVTGQCLEEQKRNHIDKHPSNKTNVLKYIGPKKDINKRLLWPNIYTQFNL